ncbi:probable basic-leucine zipper transcription factor K [Schistocerca cancellata]|uniref:probable basic-leucine zipper transcription factor K n=1 Tax=Schistocerca cancellata TaxID=274614 RepID=UPI002119B0C4|nr:probable basic-leucine zipper transcription factor K [Schistocerca cancellata]
MKTELSQSLDNSIDALKVEIGGQINDIRKDNNTFRQEVTEQVTKVSSQLQTHIREPREEKDKLIQDIHKLLEDFASLKSNLFTDLETNNNDLREEIQNIVKATRDEFTDSLEEVKIVINNIQEEKLSQITSELEKEEQELSSLKQRIERNEIELNESQQRESFERCGLERLCAETNKTIRTDHNLDFVVDINRDYNTSVGSTENPHVNGKEPMVIPCTKVLWEEIRIGNSDDRLRFLRDNFSHNVRAYNNNNNSNPNFCNNNEENDGKRREKIHRKQEEKSSEIQEYPVGAVVIENVGNEECLSMGAILRDK